MQESAIDAVNIFRIFDTICRNKIIIWIFLWLFFLFLKKCVLTVIDNFCSIIFRLELEDQSKIDITFSIRKIEKYIDYLCI